MNNLCSGTQCGGFQFLLILDLLGISFHVVVVFGMCKDLLFKSVLGHCVKFQPGTFETLDFSTMNFLSSTMNSGFENSGVEMS